MIQTVTADSSQLNIADSFRAKGFYFPARAFSVKAALDLCSAYYRSRERAAVNPVLAATYGIFKPHLLTTWADSIVHCPKILDVAEQLIGPNLLAWSTDIFVRPPINRFCSAGLAGKPIPPSGLVAPSGLAWHQDATYLGLSPLNKIVRMWVALTETTPENGTMRFLPESHLLGECTHKFAPDDDQARGERICMDIDLDDVANVELEPGEFSVHDVRTVHDSGENQTDRDRICVSITYVAPEVTALGCSDTAMLVRGEDACGNFALEPRPSFDFDPAAVAAYSRAMNIRLQRLRMLCGSIEA